jgi:aminoglycoside phosphotransferase (APT) family kinase protein
MTLAAPAVRPTTQQLIDVLSIPYPSPAVLHERIAWDYCSSYPIEELVVSLGGQPPERVLFKDLSPSAMLGDARRVKMGDHRDPLREIAVYRHALATGGLSTPRLIAAVAEPAIGRYWLFLEKVEGPPLWQVGEFEAWLEAARFLGRMHRQFASNTVRLIKPARLIRYDGEACLTWLDRAAKYAPSLLDDRRAMVERLVAVGPAIASRIDALPATFVHGEFYASNVLVEAAESAPRVRPVDWEMAGVGPGLIDLAAITAGKWTAEQRAAFVDAYRQAGEFSLRDFDEAFDLCRLYQAIHCIGWSPTWSPPAEHAFDWLGHATQLAKGLGLLR